MGYEGAFTKESLPVAHYSMQKNFENFKNSGFGYQQESKAYMYARALQKHTIHVVSENFTAQELEEAFLRKAFSVEQVLAAAGNNSRILFIPYAGSLLPRIIP